MSQASDAPPETPPSPANAEPSSPASAESMPTEEPADAEPEDAPLPLDQVFGVLKNQRRRRVLRMLQDADGQLSLSDLAEQIAAWENDKPIKQITSGERKRVYVGLYQCHLPKMDGMGVINFNKPRGTIELGDNMEIMYRYLDTADEPDEPEWHRYSMGLSLVGVAGLGSALLTQPMTTLPVMDIAVVALLVAFAAYGAVCLHWTSRRAEAEDSSAPE
ncbi:hypothetical protein EGH24_11905 [Halonotius terrestris]|uniref:DUF7344 domain-containing protein n=1 Tax=Halonotius terrestris TaxID=2487750 RepID=A0A8J8P7M4_9EURY|nr:hypothetical protein [Halonotius terrestris]TQQ79328.1 hypothetical protein EGH24_11905 [Halonotius terrestris]